MWIVRSTKSFPLLWYMLLIANIFCHIIFHSIWTFWLYHNSTNINRTRHVLEDGTASISFLLWFPLSRSKSLWDCISVLKPVSVLLKPNWRSCGVFFLSQKQQKRQSLSFNYQEALPHRIHLGRYIVGNTWKNTAPSFYWETRQNCNWQILSLSRPRPRVLLLFPLAVSFSSSLQDLGCLGWCILLWAFIVGHDPQQGPWVLLRFKQMINKEQIPSCKLHFIHTIQILLPQKELVYIHLVQNEGWTQVSWV